MEKKNLQRTASGITQGSRARIAGSRLCYRCKSSCYRKDLTTEQLEKVMAAEAAADSKPEIRVKQERVERSSKSPSMAKTSRKKAVAERPADVKVKEVPANAKPNKASVKCVRASLVDKADQVDDSKGQDKKDETKEKSGEDTAEGEAAVNKTDSSIMGNMLGWINKKFKKPDDDASAQDKSSDSKEQAQKQQADDKPQAEQSKKRDDPSTAIKHQPLVGSVDKNSTAKDIGGKDKVAVGEKEFPREMKLLLLKGYVMNELSRELLNISSKQAHVDRSSLAQQLHKKAKSEFTNLEKTFCKLVKKDKPPQTSENKYCLKSQDLCKIEESDQKNVVQYTVSQSKLWTNEIYIKNKLDSEQLPKEYLAMASNDSSVRLSKQWSDQCGIAKVMRQIGSNISSP